MVDEQNTPLPAEDCAPKVSPKVTQPEGAPTETQVAPSLLLPVSSALSTLLVVGAIGLFVSAFQGPIVSQDTIRMQFAAANVLTKTTTATPTKNTPTTPEGAAKEECTAEAYVKGDAEKRKVGKICTPKVSKLNPSDKTDMRVKAETNCKPSYEVPPGECWAKVCTPGYFGFESCTIIKRGKVADVESAALESYKGNRPLSDVLPNQFRDAEESLCKNDAQCKLYAQETIGDVFRDPPPVTPINPEEARKRAEELSKQLNGLAAICKDAECELEKRDTQLKLLEACKSMQGTRPAYCTDVAKLIAPVDGDPGKKCPTGTTGTPPRCTVTPPAQPPPPPPPPPGPPLPSQQQTQQPSAPGKTGGNPFGSLLGDAKQQLQQQQGQQPQQLQQQPTCTITATPSTIKRGEPVTLSWQTMNVAGSLNAYIAGLGAVPLQGSTTLSPMQTTTFSMAVLGYVQQQSSTNQPQYQFANVPVGASCVSRVDVTEPVASTPNGVNVSAELSCVPKLADVGQSVALTFACRNAKEARGEGFETGGKLDGETTTVLVPPEKGKGTPSAVTYKLTCIGENNQKPSNTCTVRINKTSIVMVANPKEVASGETTNIGWATIGMKSCIISSSQLTEWSAEQKNKPKVKGVVKTPALTEDVVFNLVCETKSGGTKTASTTVTVK